MMSADVVKKVPDDNIPLRPPSLQLNGNIIEREYSLKLLGVYP